MQSSAEDEISPSLKRSRLSVDTHQSTLDEINCISPRIVARRRKARSVNVSTLPDHVNQRLRETFSKIDMEGTGSVVAKKVVDLVKQGYLPTEEEVANVRSYFNLQPGHRLEFDSLLCAFARATECVLVMGNPTLSERGESDFQVLRETFHFEVMQVARSKRVQVGGNEGADNVAAARAMLGEERLMELQAYYDQLCMAGPDDESIVPEFVRQAFVLPQKKADQLMTFFDSNKDGMVSLDEFIHGMTLLYGELGNLYQQLKTKAPGTPLMSPMGGPPQGAPHPSPLMSPRLAFDGPVPMMATQHEEMADIVI